MKSLSILSRSGLQVLALSAVPFSAATAVTANWSSPNSAYVSITDAATWGGTAPDQAGDIGNMTGVGPIRVSFDHSSAWDGTLNVNPSSSVANLLWSNSGVGNGNSVSRMNLTNAAIIAQSTVNSSDRPLGAPGDIINLSGINVFDMSNTTSTTRGWNIRGNIEGSGEIDLRSRRSDNSATVQTIFRGTISDVDLNLNQARGQLNNTMGFSFTNNGDNINSIFGTSGSLANRLLINGDFNVDVAGFDPNLTAKRSWNLIDWTNITDASGWLGSGVLTTGSDTWSSTGTPYYNGAGGRTWTYSDVSGNDWTFTESTGVLNVTANP